MLSFSQTDSVSVSGLSVFDFSDSYGLDWTLLTGDMHFLCMSYPPSILLDHLLHPLVQVCCLAFALCSSVLKFNIFDHTTYPLISTLIEQDLLFMVMSQFAPQWLLGSHRFTNWLHSNLEFEVPKEVIGTFLAGMKSILPIAMKKSLVLESWNEFCD